MSVLRYIIPSSPGVPQISADWVLTAITYNLQDKPKSLKSSVFIFLSQLLTLDLLVLWSSGTSYHYDIWTLAEPFYWVHCKKLMMISGCRTTCEVCGIAPHCLRFRTCCRSISINEWINVFSFFSGNFEWNHMEPHDLHVHSSAPHVSNVRHPVVGCGPWDPRTSVRNGENSAGISRWCRRDRVERHSPRIFRRCGDGLPTTMILLLKMVKLYTYRQ